MAALGFINVRGEGSGAELLHMLMHALHLEQLGAV